MATKPVILLLDDEEDLVHGLADALQRSMPAYDVVPSTTIEDAESRLAAMEAADGELSLVVVDHILGGSTGIEFLRGLRQRFPQVPSILYTGRAPVEVEADAAEVGARVLWKPARLASWLGEVQLALRI